MALTPQERARRFHHGRVTHAGSPWKATAAAWSWVVAELRKADPHAARPAMQDLQTHLIRIADNLNQRRGTQL